MENKEKKSLIESSQASKKKSKFMLIAFVLVAVVLLFLLGSYFRNKGKEVEIIEYTQVQQKDLKISVETDGQVKNPKVLELSFLSNGRLEEIYIEEGLKVEAGMKLAKLTTRELELGVQKARADLQSASVNISNKKTERTDLDARSAEQSLTKTQSELHTSKKQTEQAVDEAFSLAIVQIETSFDELSYALETVDDVLKIDKSRGGSSVKRAFNDSIRTNQAKNDYESNKRNLKTLLNDWEQNAQNAEYADVSRMLWKLKDEATTVKNLLNLLIGLLEGANDSTTISDAMIESERSNTRTARNTVNKEIQDLVSAKKNTERALTNQQNDASDMSGKLDQVRVELENAKDRENQNESLKSGDIAILNSSWAQAKFRLDEAIYDLEMATLISPINGEVISISKEVGEYATTNDHFIQILSDQAFTTEIYVDELDITKIKQGQKANIRLASLPNTILEGQVVFISNQVTEDSNGIITYLVRVEILENEKYVIKEGMTTTVEFVIAEKLEALLIPVSSILVENGSSYVLRKNGTKQEIKTGLSDGINMEVLEGVALEDEIALSFTKNKVTANQDKIVIKKLTEGIKKDLLEGGFSEKEVRQIESGSADEDLDSKLSDWSDAEAKKDN